jgi:hypothetical protein
MIAGGQQKSLNPQMTNASTMQTGWCMKTNNEKIQDYFKYNYYQWATPRTELEAKRFALVKAWRKQLSDVKQDKEAV